MVLHRQVLYPCYSAIAYLSTLCELGVGDGDAYIIRLLQALCWLIIISLSVSLLRYLTSTMQTVSVKDLFPPKRVPHVTVRLIQVLENWSQMKEMYDLGLLFLDHQGNAIEGCIGKHQVNIFKTKLKEDTIYKIEQFMVTGQKVRNNHLYKLKLARNTEMTEVCPQPEAFPFYTYNSYLKKCLSVLLCSYLKKVPLFQKFYLYNYEYTLQTHGRDVWAPEPVGQDRLVAPISCMRLSGSTRVPKPSARWNEMCQSGSAAMANRVGNLSFSARSQGTSNGLAGANGPAQSESV